MKTELSTKQLPHDLARGHLWKYSSSPQACQCKEIFRTRQSIDSLFSAEGLRVSWNIVSGARECRLCAHLLDIHTRYPVYRQAEGKLLNSDRPHLKALCFASADGSDDSDNDDDSGSSTESRADKWEDMLIRYLYIAGLVDVAYSQALISVHPG
jgi:hypothetical protein